MKKCFLFCAFTLFALSPGKFCAQSGSYKPGPNRMVINLEASTQKFELPVKDVKAKVDNDLTYSWYKSNQVLTTKGGYAGKLLHGEFVEFYLNNSLKEKGLYRKGLKDGEWKSWYENGQLKEIITYCRGLQHGKYRSYNEKGSLKVEASYKKGLLHGKMVSYENGKMIAMHKYKNGKAIFPKPVEINPVSVEQPEKELKEKGRFHWKFWQGEKKKATGEKTEEKQPESKPAEPEKEKKSSFKRSGQKK